MSDDDSFMAFAGTHPDVSAAESDYQAFPLIGLSGSVDRIMQATRTLIGVGGNDATSTSGGSCAAPKRETRH